MQDVAVRKKTQENNAGNEHLGSLVILMGEELVEQTNKRNEKPTSLYFFQILFENFCFNQMQVTNFCKGINKTKCNGLNYNVLWYMRCQTSSWIPKEDRKTPFIPL